MKRFYFAAFAALALVTGCQKNEVIVENPTLNAPIEFGIYSSKAPSVKGGAETDLDVIKTKGFGITAFYTEQAMWTGKTETVNFMWNQKVTFGTDWEYTPVKYWPTMVDDKISFFAYAPYSENNATNGIVNSLNSATGTPTITFTVNEEASKMVDFVATNAINKTSNITDIQQNAKVMFHFKHELTRLAMSVKLDEDLATDNKTTVVLKSVTFDDATKIYYSEGTYRFGDSQYVADDKNLNTKEARGSWELDDKNAKAFNISKSLNVTSSLNVGKGYTNVISLTTDEPVSLLKDKEYLFLIPPFGEDGLNDTNKGYVKFTYDIVTTDDQLNPKYSCTEATKTVQLPAGLLKQGVAHNVTFIINVDQITVEAGIDGWGDEVNGGNVYVPYNPNTVVPQP